MRIFIAFLLIFFLFTVTLSIALASEKRETLHEEQKTPFFYYFQWAALLLILIISLFFVYQVKRASYHDKGKKLAYILTFLTLLAYSLNYHPEIEEYAKHSELPLVGMIKFFVTLADGALLTYYGVLGRHEEHEEVHEVNFDEL